MTRHVSRIYIDKINPNIDNEIPMFHVEHLLKVLRRKHGDTLYIFSKEDGEWEAKLIISGKKNNELYAKCIRQIRLPFMENKICLAFGIIKQERLAHMLEKITELGVSDLYPIITDYTNIHSVKFEKLSKHLILATEQSGRMSIPKMHNIMKFKDFISQISNNISWYSAIERKEKQKLNLEVNQNIGFIVGSEGGFSDNEKRFLSQKTKVISLSNNILRTETAAIACLAITSFLRVEHHVN